MKISIKGIASTAIIGCHGYERDKGQDILIDVGAELYPSNWIVQDSLATTVDYDELVDFVQTVVSLTHYRLLESLLQYLSEELLKQFVLIKVVTVTVTKLAICGIKAKQIKVSYTKERQFTVALALGSNARLAKQQIITAIEILGKYVHNIQIGGFYTTTPVGYTEQPDFVNTALIGQVSLRPEELLSEIKTLEKLMGKTEKLINGPRCIDIDLLLFAQLVYTHNFLIVPHKAMHLRDFVLRPLADVAGSWVHPVYKKTITELLAELKHSSIIEQIEYTK